MNLNFNDAPFNPEFFSPNPSGYPSSGFVMTSQVLPFWRLEKMDYDGNRTQRSLIWYNNPGVPDEAWIQDNRQNRARVIDPLGHSMGLDGVTGGTFILSQKGTIPTDAKSMSFRLFGQFPRVYVDDNPMFVQYFDSGNGYWEVNAIGDVSPWSGTDVTLRFESITYGAPSKGAGPFFDPIQGKEVTDTITYSILDDIRFSTSPIPEPSIVLLLLAAGPLFLVRR